MNFEEQIAIIEKHTVYRLQARTDAGGFFTSTNGMPTAHWTNTQIAGLVDTVQRRHR